MNDPSQGQKMAEILAQLANRGAVSEIDDAAAWQREVRTDLKSIQRELWDFLETHRGDIELMEQWEALKKDDPDFSTPKAWLEFFGTWVGDDFDEVFPGVRNPSQTHS